MKKAQEMANSRYRELCAVYGDLTVKMKLMQKDIAQTESAIEGLNAHVPLLLSLESEFENVKPETPGAQS